MLPYMNDRSIMHREIDVDWGGLNLNEDAGSGDFAEAINMSTRSYPLLSSRERGFSHPVQAGQTAGIEISNIAAAGAGEYLFWIAKAPGDSGWSFFAADADYDLYTKKGSVSGENRKAAGEKSFAVSKHKVFVFPDKKMYDDQTGTFVSMEASYSATGLSFQDGTFAGVTAEANTIYRSGAAWATHGFKAGDAVTISGCSQVQNNGTFIIREIDGDYLRFYENTFFISTWYYRPESDLADGYYTFDPGDGIARTFKVNNLPAGGYYQYFLNEQRVHYRWQSGGQVYGIMLPFIVGATESTVLQFSAEFVENGSVTISRSIPDMDFVAFHDNRLWGCHGDTIYASKLGDPLNFNVFDGLETDSWAVSTGTNGDFTACVAYQGHPIFFKEDMAYRVSGDRPGNFALYQMIIPGVLSGNDKSVVQVGATLFYLSPNGVCAWDGGYPSVVSSALGRDRRFYEATAGTDGKRYYLTCKEFYISSGYTLSRNRHLAYDSRYGIWTQTDFGGSNQEYTFYPNIGKRMFVMREGVFLMLNDIPDLYPNDFREAAIVSWRAKFAETAMFFKESLNGSENKKGVLRLLIRCRLEKSMTVSVRYDGGSWESVAVVGSESGTAKKSFVIPLILRRCDLWQLQLEGTGDAVIYSITTERYSGDWHQAGAVTKP